MFPFSSRFLRNTHLFPMVSLSFGRSSNLHVPIFSIVPISVSIASSHFLASDPLRALSTVFGLSVFDALNEYSIFSNIFSYNCSRVKLACSWLLFLALDASVGLVISGEGIGDWEVAQSDGNLDLGLSNFL